MAEFQEVVKYLVARGASKRTRPQRGKGDQTETAIDAAYDRVHAVVATKLDNDPALAKLEAESVSGAQVSRRTRSRVSLAIADAAEEDAGFAASLTEAVQALQDKLPEHTLQERELPVITGRNPTDGIADTGSNSILPGGVDQMGGGAQSGGPT